jgi:hypothetical protein
MELISDQSRQVIDIRGRHNILSDCSEIAARCAEGGRILKEAISKLNIGISMPRHAGHRDTVTCGHISNQAS